MGLPPRRPPYRQVWFLVLGRSTHRSAHQSGRLRQPHAIEALAPPQRAPRRIVIVLRRPPNTPSSPLAQAAAECLKAPNIPPPQGPHPWPPIAFTASRSSPATV